MCGVFQPRYRGPPPMTVSDNRQATTNLANHTSSLPPPASAPHQSSRPIFLPHGSCWGWGRTTATASVTVTATVTAACGRDCEGRGRGRRGRWPGLSLPCRASASHDPTGAYIPHNLMCVHAHRTLLAWLLTGPLRSDHDPQHKDVTLPLLPGQPVQNEPLLLRPQ